MISVVCVYNNERTLNEFLLKSLKNQTAKFELITIDNTQGKFKSAAEALNHGGNQAKGRHIMFVHQDVELGTDSWLEKAEKNLDDISDLGIAGVAGMSEKGKNNRERGRGSIDDCGEIWLWGNPVEKPEEIQTLDECLLIIPKSVFSKMQFDEKTFDHWHCYGADYCLSVRQFGLKAYVIPAFIHHRSFRYNIQNLFEYQKKLYFKHKKNYKHIYTTTGEISLVRIKLISYIELIRTIYSKFFPSWIEYLKRELSNCDTVLDLGCGYNSSMQCCDVSFSVGVELFEPYLQESKKKEIHDQYIKADITKIEFKPRSFDAVVALDVLEHLTEEEGYRLIRRMEKWARKEVIIFTPNGLIEQEDYDNNPFQEHKSGWDTEKLTKFGFNVIGINGWKKLRGYKATVKYKPTRMWMIISDMTQKITYHHPKLAFQIFAVKQIDEGEE